MNNVIIETPDKALEAIEWAEKNINTKWTLVSDPGSLRGTYNFQFEDDIDASYFAIRWR
jgi:hypothetical protein